MTRKNKDLYSEQRNNCYFSLIISIIFIIGLIFKTIYISNDIMIDIKKSLLLCLPIPFMNCGYLVLLKVYKNLLTNGKLFTKENSKFLNILMILIFIFFLSIMIIISQNTLSNNYLYCLILISINFLFSAYLIKKIFNYGVELKK